MQPRQRRPEAIHVLAIIDPFQRIEPFEDQVSRGVGGWSPFGVGDHVGDAEVAVIAQQGESARFEFEHRARRVRPPLDEVARPLDLDARRRVDHAAAHRQDAGRLAAELLVQGGDDRFRDQIHEISCVCSTKHR